MAFPHSAPGNKHNERLTTPELRQIAYKSYCEWISAGKSKTRWRLKYPVRLSWETMEKYLRGEYASEFDLEELVIARSEGLDKWESKMEAIAEGKSSDNFAGVRWILETKYRALDKNDTNETLMSAIHANEMLLKQLDSFRRKEAEEYDTNI